MPDMMVEGELWDLGDRWTCHAYGGGIPGERDSVDVLSEAPTRDEVEAKFIADWNAALGTSWAPDQFSFWVNAGKSEELHMDAAHKEG